MVMCMVSRNYFNTKKKKKKSKQEGENLNHLTSVIFALLFPSVWKCTLHLDR